ncbi:hypothetical protein DFR52_10443 [Hoeflea marina]|uniref:Alanine and proline-rich secreted protein Apa n=1 Tax=Hoeflea marina TaxID=274592 RepID=A0A317PFF2_9HYPH|nr:hypothetical protein [Hoeflea marina]PWV98754.1 hypothetical protein DFR52_10443 [Hoeflea marina]
MTKHVRQTRAVCLSWPLSLILVALVSLPFLVALSPKPAFALSELKPAADDAAPDAEIPDEPAAPELEEPQIGPDGGLPDPGPVIRAPAEPRDEDPAVTVPAAPDAAAPLPDVLTDVSVLPEPVARMRQLIIEAATTGDPEKLRALLGAGPTATRLSLAGTDDDPVAYLRSLSGDAGGQEILAIMLDILGTGFVHIDPGTPEELYVWPYFTAMPLESLTPPQRVELLRIVTAGDVEDMLGFGSYNFYRLGISPEGEWQFFLAGD